MKTIIDPKNPPVALNVSVFDGTLYCFFSDIPKHIGRLVDSAIEGNNLPAPNHGFDISIFVLDEEGIIAAEAATGSAIMTFEEAVKFVEESNIVAFDGENNTFIDVDGNIISRTKN